jgi:hypothetical protein
LLGKATSNVFVQDAGDERLIRHTFFQGLDLNIAQVARK